jgi:hypothetical protein
MSGQKQHPHRKFSEAEDALIQHLVQSGIGPNWIFIASLLPERNVRQCRERWQNYLSPGLTNAPWTAAEEEILEQKVLEFGTKWQQVVQYLPQRSTNQIRYHWITKCRSTSETSVDIRADRVMNDHFTSREMPKKGAEDFRNAIETAEDLFKFDRDHDWSFDGWTEPLLF